MLIIGLTGGIGSGKSAAADRFAHHHIPVIDADIIARELATPGSEGLRQIIRVFGNEYLDDIGELNRPKLRKAIFTDPEARNRLEAILHPLIRREMQRKAAALETPYCVFVIPLLLETGQKNLVDRVLVIDCSKDTQRSRVKLRDGSTDTEINAILDTQVRRDERISAADDVVANEGSLDELHQQIDRLHQHYLSLSK